VTSKQENYIFSCATILKHGPLTLDVFQFGRDVSTPISFLTQALITIKVDVDASYPSPTSWRINVHHKALAPKAKKDQKVNFFFKVNEKKFLGEMKGVFQIQKSIKN